ncbi:MAG: DUF1302 family protein [Gammaproteobacteria bacterium]
MKTGRIKKWPAVIIFILFSLLAAPGLQADDNTLSQDEMNPIADFDFSTLKIDNLEDSGGSNRLGPFVFNGFLMQEAAYSYQRSNFVLSKFRSSADLTVNAKFTEDWAAKMDFLAFYDAAYSLEGRNNFSQRTLDIHETTYLLKELYTDIDITPWMSLRLGRQYFGWGESYNNQISDIGNPRDLRELGLQNVENIRLSVGAAKLTFYGSGWEYNLIAIPEIRPHLIAGEDSEFDPFKGARSDQVMILDPVKPTESLSNTQYLTRLYLSRDWGDVSFYWGEVFDDFPVLDIYSIGRERIVFQPVYQKIRSYGLFGNLVNGSWSLKFDIARKLDKPFNFNESYLTQQILSNQDSVRAYQDKNLFQWMVGLQYSGFSETLISLNYFNQLIENYDDTLRDREQSSEVSLFLTRDFMNDKLTTTLWWNYLIEEDSHLIRFDVNYKYDDHLQFSLALNSIEADKKNSFYYDYRKSDRITFGIKYSF